MVITALEYQEEVLEEQLTIDTAGVSCPCTGDSVVMATFSLASRYRTSVIWFA